MYQTQLKRTLAAGASWSLFARIATTTASLAVNVVLAQLLAPKEVGVFNLARSFVWGASILITLGLPSAITKLVAAHQSLKQDAMLRAAAFSSLSIALASFLIFGLIYTLLLSDWFFDAVMEAPELSHYANSILAWVGSFSLLALLSGYFRGLHDVRLAALSEELFCVTITFALLLGVWLLWGNLSLAVSLNGMAYACCVVAALFFLRSLRTMGPFQRPGVKVTRTVLTLAWPAFVTNVTVFLLCQADMWILGTFTSTAEVGIYSVAYRLAMLVAVFPSVINSAVMPFISSLYVHNKRRTLQVMMRAAALISFLPALSLFMIFVGFGAEVLTFLFGARYSDGYLPLLLLAAGQLSTAFVCSASFALTMTGHQKLMMYAAIAASLLSLMLSLLLVRKYQAVGVAVGSATGAIMLQMLAWDLVRRKLGMSSHPDLRQSSKIISLIKSVLSGRQ